MLFYGRDLFVLKVLSAPIQTDGFHIKECDCVYLPSAASWHDCETHLCLKALERCRCGLEVFFSRRFACVCAFSVNWCVILVPFHVFTYSNICLSRLLHFSAALMEKMSTLCRLVGVSVYIIVPKADETLRQVMLLWELTQGNLLVTRAVLLERNTPVDGSRFILVKERIAGMRKKPSRKYKNGRVFHSLFII